MSFIGDDGEIRLKVPGGGRWALDGGRFGVSAEIVSETVVWDVDAELEVAVDVEV